MLLLENRSVGVALKATLTLLLIAGIYVFFFSKKKNEPEFAEQENIEVPVLDLHTNGEYTEPEVSSENTLASNSMSVPTGVALDELNEPHEHLLESWKGRIDPPLRNWESLEVSVGDGGTTAFKMPNGTELTLNLSRYEQFDTDKGVYVGSVADKPYSEVTLGFVRDAVSGAIRFPEEGVSWEIRNAGDGEQYFELVDLSALGECGACQATE